MAIALRVELLDFRRIRRARRLNADVAEQLRTAERLYVGPERVGTFDPEAEPPVVHDPKRADALTVGVLGHDPHARYGRRRDRPNPRARVLLFEHPVGS